MVHFPNLRRFSLFIFLVCASGSLGAQEFFDAPALPIPPPPSAPPIVLVEPPLSSTLQTTLGIRTWLSTGRSSLSYAGVNGVPDVMSELHWTRQRNPMIELSGDMIWYDHLVVHTDLGVGTAGTGRLRDQDFNGSGHTDLASDTIHPVNSDNLYYFNLDIGCRLVTWHGFSNPDSSLAVDALIGWQHWSEKYVARDGIDLFPGDRAFPPGDVIASRLSWDSLRIGLRGQWQFCERGMLESRVFFIPYTDFENADIHYLRTDLLNDPSFCDHAHGGIGVQGDLTLSWKLTPHLGLELGYRAWDIRSNRGDSLTRTPDGDFVTPLNRATTLRHGALLGLHWTF